MGMTASLRVMISVGALIAAASTANATAYSFTQLDVPGASGTIATGINDAGQIVGHYLDPRVIGAS